MAVICEPGPVSHVLQGIRGLHDYMGPHFTVGTNKLQGKWGTEFKESLIHRVRGKGSKPRTILIQLQKLRTEHSYIRL